jgi:hypothetical protein
MKKRMCRGFQYIFLHQEKVLNVNQKVDAYI